MPPVEHYRWPLKASAGKRPVGWHRPLEVNLTENVLHRRLSAQYKRRVLPEHECRASA